MIKLTNQENKVLGFLACADRDFGCYPFHALARETCLTVREVRRACRSLARKGLVQCYHGLWTESGEMAGSGYGATDVGRKAWDEMIEVKP